MVAFIPLLDKMINYYKVSLGSENVLFARKYEEHDYFYLFNWDTCTWVRFDKSFETVKKHATSIEEISELDFLSETTNSLDNLGDALN